MVHHRLLAAGLLAVPLLGAVPAGAAPKVACAHVRSDFNGDGRSDVAAGAPADRNQGDDEASRSGSLSIVYDPTGGAGKQLIPGTFTAGITGFGAAVAAGYFDADCYADAVVGASGKAVVLYGSATGLGTTRARLFGASSIPGGTPFVFGSPAAAGDFNHDGFDDIAVGAPGPSHLPPDGGPDPEGGGAVGILYGSATGITATGGRWLVEGAGGLPDTASAYDGFGSALAVGDFTGDGFADLAAGAPGERGGASSEFGGGGGVIVVRGSSTGLTGAGSVYLDQSSPGVPGTLEQDDLFGAALAAGDVTGDGLDDLVVGSPGEALGSIVGAGSLSILKGSPAGVTGAGTTGFDQDSDGIPGSAEQFDYFGDSLAIVDLNGDGRQDLAVGSPFEDVGSTQDTGSITAIYGKAGGLSATGARFIDQNSAGVPGSNEQYDHFASPLAAIPGALVVGAPDEQTSSGAEIFAGAFTVLTGNLSAGKFFGPSQFPRGTTGDGNLGASLS